MAEDVMAYGGLERRIEIEKQDGPRVRGMP